MQTTTNFGLKKPEGTDYINVNDLNENADKIDTELKSHADSLTEVSTHLADKANNIDATRLTTAKDVTGAVNELFTNVSNGKTLVGGAITDVDPNVIIPADPTFQNLADGIGQISTGKKWASGTTTSTMSLDIKGLDFTPGYILIESRRNGFAWCHRVYFKDALNNSTLASKTISNADGANYHTSYFTIFSDGFKVVLDTVNHTQITWIAFE